MNSQKNEQSLALTIAARALSFPFFVGIALAGAAIIFARWTINFVRFGGETIAYTEKTNRKTILDTFEKLRETQRRETP